MPRAAPIEARKSTNNNIVNGGDPASNVKHGGKVHLQGQPPHKTLLNPNGKENEVKTGGRSHIVGPSQTKTLLNPNGKEPVDPKPAGKARGQNEYIADQSTAASHPNKNDETATTRRGKTFSPGKNPNKAAVAEKQEPPIFGRGAFFADPMNPNSIQQKVIDRPLMFRGSGLHPRATTPGRAAPRFARSNTNVSLWQGDIATVKSKEEMKSASKTTDNAVVVSQRCSAMLKATEKFKPKQVGLFFVKENQNQQQKKPSSSSATTGGQVDLFSPEKLDHTSSMNNDGPREIDCLSGSRRGGPPAELKSLTRANLRVGIAVPDENVSIARNQFGKRLIEKSSGSPRSTNELVHHGKKAFPEKVATSYSARQRANEVGSPARTQQEHSPNTILANKRFENTRRFQSNLHSGLVVNDVAPAQDVAYDHGKKKSDVQSKKQSLQYVFEAPKRDVNTSYRPTAPWATD
jgi:hypothetical protein